MWHLLFKCEPRLNVCQGSLGKDIFDPLSQGSLFLATWKLSPPDSLSIFLSTQDSPTNLPCSSCLLPVLLAKGIESCSPSLGASKTLSWETARMGLSCSVNHKSVSEELLPCSDWFHYIIACKTKSSLKYECRPSFYCPSFSGPNCRGSNFAIHWVAF